MKLSNIFFSHRRFVLTVCLGLISLISIVNHIKYFLLEFCNICLCVFGEYCWIFDWIYVQINIYVYATFNMYFTAPYSNGCNNSLFYFVRLCFYHYFYWLSLGLLNENSKMTRSVMQCVFYTLNRFHCSLGCTKDVFKASRPLTMWVVIVLETQTH